MCCRRHTDSMYETAFSAAGKPSASVSSSRTSRLTNIPTAQDICKDCFVCKTVLKLSATFCVLKPQPTPGTKISTFHCPTALRSASSWSQSPLQMTKKSARRSCRRAACFDRMPQWLAIDRKYLELGLLSEGQSARICSEKASTPC